MAIGSGAHERRSIAHVSHGAISVDIGPDRRGARRSSRFVVLHLLVPLALCLGAGLLCFAFDTDFRIADQLYAWQGQQWLARDLHVTNTLLHKGGRNLSWVAWLVALGACMTALARPRMALLRRPLCYLVVATLIAASLVAWIKNWSNIDCPWDLARYGGERPWVGLFAARPPGLGHAACFPAGHASSGYAWFSLYFYLRVVRPRWRAAGLALAMGSGLVFGITQQVRGAHFFSHDIVTAALCWSVALGLYWLFWRQTSRAEPSA